MTASLPDSHTLPATVLVTELHHSMGHYSGTVASPRWSFPQSGNPCATIWIQSGASVAGLDDHAEQFESSDLFDSHGRNEHGTATYDGTFDQVSSRSSAR